MSHSAGDASPDQGSGLPPAPPWTRATGEDIAGLDFDAPIDGATTADCNELSDLYRSAATPSDGWHLDPEGKISSLFEQIRPELDSILTTAITADVESVFLTKPGPYLRHALSHGPLHNGDPCGADAIYACWLIFRLCLLPLYPHGEWLRSMLNGGELCRA